MGVKNLFKLVGYSPYENNFPCFAEAIFIPDVGNPEDCGYFVQDTCEVDGTVSGFWRVSDVNLLEVPSNGHVVAVGDDHLVIFVTSDEKLIIGSAASIAGPLEPHLSAPTTPLSTKIQISDLLGRKSDLVLLGRILAADIFQRSGYTARGSYLSSVATSRLWESLIAGSKDKDTALNFIHRAPRPIITIERKNIRVDLYNTDLSLFPGFDLTEFLEELREDFLDKDDLVSHDPDQEDPLDVEISAESLKKFLDVTYGPEVIPRNWWYGPYVNVLRQLGFNTIGDIERITQELNAKQVSDLAFGMSEVGAGVKFEILMTVVFGEEYFYIVEGRESVTRMSIFYKNLFKKCAESNIEVGSLGRQMRSGLLGSK